MYKMKDVIQTIARRMYHSPAVASTFHVLFVMPSFQNKEGGRGKDEHACSRERNPRPALFCPPVNYFFDTASKASASASSRYWSAIFSAISLGSIPRAFAILSMAFAPTILAA